MRDIPPASIAGHNSDILRQNVAVNSSGVLLGAGAPTTPYPVRKGKGMGMKLPLGMLAKTANTA